VKAFSVSKAYGWRLAKYNGSSRLIGVSMAAYQRGGGAGIGAAALIARRRVCRKAAASCGEMAASRRENYCGEAVA